MFKFFDWITWVVLDCNIRPVYKYISQFWYWSPDTGDFGWFLKCIVDYFLITSMIVVIVIISPFLLWEKYRPSPPCLVVNIEIINLEETFSTEHVNWSQEGF